jgi:hypothetical protein
VHRGALGQQRGERVVRLGGGQGAQGVQLGEVGVALALEDIGELRAAGARGGDELEVEGLVPPAVRARVSGPGTRCIG